MRRSILVLLGLIVATPSILASEAVIVSQHNRKFWPETLVLPIGAKIKIMNDDRVTHHVYVDAPKMNYDSGEMPVGASLVLSFDQAGTFPVRCAIHPTMHLDITVQ